MFHRVGMYVQNQTGKMEFAGYGQALERPAKKVSVHRIGLIEGQRVRNEESVELLFY